MNIPKVLVASLSNPSNFRDKVAQLEDLRRKAAEPVRVKIAYDFDLADVRTHSRIRAAVVQQGSAR